MIKAIQDIQQGLQYIETNFDDIILSLVKDHEKEVIAMNVDDQLFAGMDGNGKRITPPYSKKYAKFKQRKGLPVDRVTTRLEGDFHESFSIVYRGVEFELVASDFKKPYLDRKYSSFDLYGLTPENIERLANMLAPELIDIIRRKMNI